MTYFPTPVWDGCRVSNSADTTLTTGVSSFIAFNTEARDTAAYHDTVTNNSRVTIPTGKGGIYNLDVHLRVTATTVTSLYNIFFRKNGTTTIKFARFQPLNTAVGAVQSVHMPLSLLGESLVATDYIEVGVNQDSGVNQTVDGTGTTVYSSVFTVVRVGP